MPDSRTARLYAAYGGTIYARCLHLLGDRAAAEDATQETFLRVHRHLDDAPEEPRSLVWLYRIATNLCLTMIRDRKPQEQLSDQLVERRDIDAVLADRLLASQVIARVPEGLRLVAWLRFVDGLGLEEVAEVLDVTKRTVTNRLIAFAREARKALEGSHG